MSQISPLLSTGGMQPPVFPPASELRLIVIEDDINVKAHQLFKQVAVAATQAQTALDHQEVSHRVDTIIWEHVGMVFAVSLVPAIGNWLLWAAAMAGGVVRIGREYGRALDRKNARKLVLEVLKTAGGTYVYAMATAKALIAVTEATGVGYAAVAPLDIALSTALAYGVLRAVKVHFSGTPMAELGPVVKQGVASYRELAKQHGGKPPELANVVPLDYEKLAQLIASPIAREIVHASLRRHPDVLEALAQYLAAHHVARMEDLSLKQLKDLDKHDTLAMRIWYAVSTDVDMATLLEVAGSAALDVAAVHSLDRLHATAHVTALTAAEAAQFTFPPQHPRPRVVYACHPLLTATYFPAATFHRFVFEHKLLEAQRLLEALGATYMELEQVGSRTEELSASAQVGTALTGVGAGAAAGRHRASDTRIALTGVYKDTGQCALPDNLVWYPNEPLWQQIATARREGRLTRFSLEVSYNDDFGVNAGLQASVLEIGCFELGGKFESRELFGSRIVGEFGAMG